MSFLDRRFHIRWSTLTPDRVVPEITEALGLAELAIDALCRQDRGRMNFDSVFLGYERALEPLSEAWGLVGHLDAVCNSEPLRAAYNEMLPKVSDFFTRLTLNESIWDLFVTFARTDEARALTGIQRRFLEETMADFRQNGAELPEEKKERLASLQSELAMATQKYSENVLDSTNAWDLIVTDATRLLGLPDVVKEAARADARAKGIGSDEAPAWRLTLKAPSLFPVLEHAEDESLRRQIWEASATIGRGGPYDNTDLVWQILRLRQEKAELLGHPHFPDLVLQRRMAKDGATARTFITDLHTRIAKPFAGETRALQEFRAEATGTVPQPLEPWEVAFWSERQRKTLYDFDQEELRPYFPIDGVLDGMFRLCENLFGLSIRTHDSIFIEPGHEPPPGTPPAEVGGPVEVWHAEVKFYEILDADGTHLGSFYADWHPRDSKRGGAWMNYLKTGHPPRGDRPGTPHLGLMCGNMTPSTPDQPSLLTHDEVETVFHEFGHLLHHLLGNVEIKSLNGVNVAWDFVELPSQLMENFCWERKSLDFFARHYQTGEPIPPKLFKKMVAAKNYQSALATMRQLSLGKLDLDLHLNAPHPQGKSLDEVAEEILEGYLMPLKTRPPTMARRFTHLFADPTGYAAGYYSYKWAEVLEADAFSRFKRDGVLSPKIGRQYRERLLSRGNSADPAQLFREFMGRDPDPEALLRRSGLA
ncbi:MAG: M3 family metallopeptidase [Verrucomicrobiales bacterium]